MDDDRSEGLEDRAGGGDVRLLAADHDGQGPLDGTRLPARHGCVDRALAALPGCRGHPDGHLRPDGAGVGEERAGLG